MTENNDDIQIETVISNIQRLLQRAETTPVELFPAVAEDLLPGVIADEQNQARPRGFRTSTDQIISRLSTPVNITSIDAKIRSFTRCMPSGPGRIRPVDRIGNHRSTVPLSNGRNSNGHTCGSDYTMEKNDPAHRMANLIDIFKPLAPQDQGLYEWMSSLSYFQVYGLLRSEKYSLESIQRIAPSFMRGVKYLDAAARMSYRVDIRNGVLHWANTPLDTEVQNLQTVFSGIGWGIWVLSPGGEFYTGSHKSGEFHHSSFLSGEPVKAAGEWQVINGQIRFITGKTGHYRCDVNALVLALRQLAGMDALKASAKVIIWESDTPGSVPALDFMKDPALQDRCQAFGKYPLTKPLRNPPARENGVKRNATATGPKIGGHRGASQQVIPQAGHASHQQNTHQNSYQPESYNNQPH